jgi:hypothetical protein
MGYFDPKYYTEKQRRLYGVGWFIIASVIGVFFSYINWSVISYIFFCFAGLSLYFGFFKNINENNEQSILMKTLMCPKCKIKEELFNLYNREDSTLFMYNQHNPRVRPEDGLHIFPIICFECKLVTEFASDPMNESGKAIDGVEYFLQRKITKKDKNDASVYAKQINSCLLKKINSIKVK